jgi:sugar O-acyltransferase (sialic acid O-acetyltransferase NeuD family)
MQRLRIFGAGIRAKIIVDAIAWQFSEHIKVEGFYDDRLPVGEGGPGGFPIFGSVSDGAAYVRNSDCSAFVALGTRSAWNACRLFMELQAAGVNILRIISPTASVSPSARIGQNAFIAAGVFIGSEVRIGHMFCAHGGSVVEHDCQIGNNVLLGPGVAVASKVFLGSHSFLGTGCKVVPETKIGKGALLGAGSLVIRDIPDYVVAYGQPAVPRRSVQKGDELATENEIRDLLMAGLE